MSMKPSNTHNKNEPIVPDKNNMAYPSRTLDPPIRLSDRAKEIEQAHSSLQNQVNGKLDLIVQQIRFLQQQAEQILCQAQTDLDLHQIPCAFEKVTGQIVHLYEKENGNKYFSLLGPAEWQPIHKFLASYRLRPDQSFELIATS